MHADPSVLIDATAIPADRGGVGRYVDQLVGALDGQLSRLTVVCQPRDEAIFADLAPHSRVVAAPAKVAARAARFAWEQTTLPALARRVGAKVIHSPHYTMPLGRSIPVVVTLHDATFFSDRHLHLGVKGRFFRAWTRTALRQAAACVVPSQATADELIAHVGARVGAMIVAYHGVDSAVFHPPSARQREEFAQRFGLADQTWLAFLGTLEPRKNIPALINAFVAACHNRANPPALLLAGSPGWDQAVEPALAAVPDHLTATATGHLPVGELKALLGGAQLVCYPSLGEGFGLPVLEAMACRAAVLTTRRLSLPEVGGDAVAYTDVDVRSIATALRELLDDPARREQLADAALHRSARFTWAASAAAHRAAYRRAAAGSA